MNAESNFTARFSPVAAKPEAFFDEKTGLMIASHDLVLPNGTYGFRHDNDEIETALRNFRCAGHNDWRFWNDEEACSLIDRSKHGPAADPVLNLAPEWYWTSTRYKPNEASFAWAVGFGRGLVLVYNRDGRFRVRAVRSARQ